MLLLMVLGNSLNEESSITTIYGVYTNPLLAEKRMRMASNPKTHYTEKESENGWLSLFPDCEYDESFAMEEVETDTAIEIH